MVERTLRWLIRVLSKQEWAEAMVAEADHLPEVTARRRWLAGAALTAVTRSVGRLAGVCVAGSLVSYAVWRHSAAELAYLTLAVVLLAAFAGGFVWLARPGSGTASGVVAAALAATAAMPWGGPFSDMGLMVRAVTLPLTLAGVAAVVAMTAVRMMRRAEVTQRAFVNGIWAAMLMFVLAVVLGLADAAVPAIQFWAVYPLGLIAGPAVGLVAVALSGAISREKRQAASP